MRIERLRRAGYVFRLIFLWTPNPEFSIHRVAARVKAGGHHIPEGTIRRRYTAGMVNFFQRYRPIADAWEVYDNTGPRPILVADGRMGRGETIVDLDIWTRMRRGGGDA